MFGSLVFRWVNLRELDNFEDVGFGRMILLKWIFMKLVAGDLDLVELAQERDISGSCGSVNDISTSIKCRRMSWLTEELFACQEWLCSTNLVKPLKCPKEIITFLFCSCCFHK